ATQAELALDVFTMALNRLRAQIQGFGDLFCAKSRTEQLENMHLPIRENFDVDDVLLRVVLPRCLERFLKGMQGYFSAYIYSATQNSADGHEQLSVRCLSHPVTLSPSTQSWIGK